MKNILKKTTLLSVLILSFLLCGIFSACSEGVTLKFDAKGGVSLEQFTAPQGSSFELPTPFYEGMVFGGWYTSEDLSGTPFSGTIEVPAENTTYYAKWENGYTLTLDADGGTASLSELTLPAGANVSEALQGVVASKEGLTFGAWFYEGAELSSSFVMPERDITLKAKYKVNYTVEVYLGNLAGNAYVGSEEQMSFGSGYVGETVSAGQPMIAHFEYNAEPEGYTPVTSLLLSGNEQENVMRLYYDRTVYSVLYSGNAVEAEGSVPEQRVSYGNTIPAEDNGFSREGYRFAGWSFSPTGEVEFIPGQDVSVSSSAILYAVWDRGYTDRYGSGDLVFFPRLEPGKAVLRRGGYEFEGTREGENFLFMTDSGKEIRGRVLGNSFSYVRSELEGKYIYYMNSSNPADGGLDEQLIESRTLEIDEYMNGTLTDGSHVCKGEVVFDYEMGDYTFQSEDHAFHFLLSTIKDENGVSYNVYAVGGPESGAFVDFYLINRETGAGYSGMSMLLMLDGYRTASLLDATNYLYYDGYYYVEDVYGDANNPIYKIVLMLKDPNGYLSGVPGSTVYNFVYTVPLDGEYDGYVTADETYGEYEGESGGTLVLDGFGIFADSAVYTLDEKVYSGSYTVENDILTGRTVTINAGREKFVFHLDEKNHTFGDPSVRDSYTAYRRMNGNALGFPFVVLYDDVREGEGLKAEIYVPDAEDSSVLVIAAKGYYKKEEIGRNSRFSAFFVTVTERTLGYEELVPEQELVFFNSIATSTQTHESYDIYCLLRWDKESYVQVVNIGGGDEIIWCKSVTADGIGSLLVRANGVVEEGSFSWLPSEYFLNNIGTFLYVDEQGYVRELIYDVVEEDDGSISAKPAEGKETMLYVVPRTGYDESVMGREVIFLNGKGEAVYTEDGGTQFRRGSYSEVDQTEFGETVYSLVIGGGELFRFVVRYRPEYGTELAFASVYNEKCDKLFRSESGELLLDGFYRACYMTADGQTVYGDYDGTERQITFVADDGMEYIVKLDAENASFRFVDWAAGREWTLLDTNYLPVNGFTLRFDGDGTVILTAGGNSTFGTYRALQTTHVYSGKAYPEYLIHADLGKGYGENTYRVAFAINSEGMGACILFREETLGYFISEDWVVLDLDGYGFGTMVSDSFTAAGSYEYVDASEGFYSFTVDDPYSGVDGQTFYFLLQENGMFYMSDYKAAASIWFASDLTRISLTESGEAYVGAESAPYYVLDGTAHIFTSPKRTIQIPSGNELRYEGRTYYRWNGEKIVLRGEILFLDKDGSPAADHPNEETTLAFTPNASGTRFAATFLLRVDGKEEEYPFTLSIGYTEEGEYFPSVTYERNTYSISFSYDGTKNSSFAVKAGYNEVVYLDHNARWEPDISTPRGGRFIKSTFGFGPVSFGGVMLSGQFLYLYDADDPSTHTPISFEDISETKVETVGFSPTYGWRQEILFNYEGVDYCWDYYEYYTGGNYFFTYGLYTYETFEADGFDVRVMRFKYSHMSTTAGYVEQTAKGLKSPSLDKAVYVTLFRDGKPIVAYDTCYTLDGIGKSVWVVDNEGIIEDQAGKDTCTWGRGYLVTFQFEGESITGVKVESYRFVQVVLYMEYFVNLFIDEDGNVQIVGFALFYAPLGRYNWLENPVELKYDEETGVYTLTCERQVKGNDGYTTVRDVYEIKVEEGEDNEDGNPTYSFEVEKKGS